MDMAARFLMIALDGADGALVDALSADGTLPNLAALRARGQAKYLSAPAGITDDGLWASFQYSAGLGEHGRYYYLQRMRSGKIGMAHGEEAGRETFWDLLSSDGFRVAVFDVPKCRSPRQLNGIHLADWIVHGHYFAEPKSHPASLAREIVERFGPEPPSICGQESGSPEDVEVLDVTRNLGISVSRKRDASLHYLSSEAWDLFLVGFKEAHCAGHTLWDFADSSHPGHDAARNARLGKPFLSIMKQLDDAVGALASAAGADAEILVFSTTGMEANSTLDHLMPEIVDRLNKDLGQSWLDETLYRLMRKGRSARQGGLCELLPYNENCTALRIHARRRLWPHGHGARERIIEQVEQALRDLKDADTGESVVVAVDRPSTDFAGARGVALPDILVRYRPGAMPRAVVSPRLGRFEATLPPVRPGNHAPGGFLIFAGEEDIFRINTMMDLGPMTRRILQPGL